jgi:hypothetical protein
VCGRFTLVAVLGRPLVEVTNQDVLKAQVIDPLLRLVATYHELHPLPAKQISGSVSTQDGGENKRVAKTATTRGPRPGQNRSRNVIDFGAAARHPLFLAIIHTNWSLQRADASPSQPLPTLWSQLAVYSVLEVIMNESCAGAAAVAAMALAGAFYFTATSWFKHRERMAMIERGLNPDQQIPWLPLSDRVKELASDPTKKIEAIKVHREETGASLAQAKQAVDAFTTSK